MSTLFIEEKQHMPLQSTPRWREDYFELKATEETQIQRFLLFESSLHATCLSWQKYINTCVLLIESFKRVFAFMKRGNKDKIVYLVSFARSLYRGGALSQPRTSFPGGTLSIPASPTSAVALSCLGASVLYPDSISKMPPKRVASLLYALLAYEKSSRKSFTLPWGR